MFHSTLFPKFQPVGTTQSDRQGPHIELNVLNEKSGVDERPPKKKGCISAFKRCKTIVVLSVSLFYDWLICSLEENYY